MKNIVVIGNFDGCHRGHRELVAKATSLATEMGLKSLALTFDPNPRVFFGVVKSNGLIFQLGQKKRALEELGISEVSIKRFNLDLMHMSPSKFYNVILKDECQAAAVVVGEDFRFGHQKSGDIEELKNLCQADGIHIYPVSLFCSEGCPVKSSVIRQILLETGDVDLVKKMLGHYFSLEGTVDRGRQLGRTIGIPTANLGNVLQLIPKVGVYAGYALFQNKNKNEIDFPLTELPHKAIPAVINVGRRPTVSENEALTIEAHLLAKGIGLDSLYGMSAIYYFIHRLRDEIKFSDMSVLKKQIERDIQAAKRLLKDQ